MKNHWINEIARSALQTRYYGEFRYADYPKALADMCYDITIPDDRIIEDCTTEITAECLGRYINGYTKKTTGEYYYTTPVIEKMEIIDAYLGELPTALTAPHLSDIEEAIAFGHTNGFDQIADQSLLGGVLRGTFYSEIIHDNGAIQMLMQVHLLKDEPYFRVRSTMVNYDHHDHESLNDLERRVDVHDWDGCKRYDGFAVTGTNKGKIFFVKHTDIGNEVIEIDNYNFFEKGRRILTFDLRADQLQTARFQLIRKPDEIEHANRLLASIPH